MPSSLANFGSIDFVQYWSAYHLLVGGANPYDPQLTLTMQCSVGLHCTYPRTTYTPPWLWLLMSPVLRQPFETAVWMWSQVSIALALASGGCLAWAFRLRPSGFLLTAAAALLSFPFLIDLLFGQLSAVLLLGATLLFVGRTQGMPPLDAAGLVLLSAKPHLFLPLVCAVGVFELRNRQMRTFCWSFALLVPLIVVAEWLSPGVVRGWLGHLFEPQVNQGVKATTDWATDAPAAALSRALAGAGISQAKWPLVLVPLIGLTLGLGIGWRLRHRSDWTRNYPLLLWLSLVTAPFVWFSDFAILQVMFAVTVARLHAIGARRRAGLVVAALAGVAVVLQRLEYTEVRHFGLAEMFWYPFLVIALWRVSGIPESREHAVTTRE